MIFFFLPENKCVSSLLKLGIFINQCSLNIQLRIKPTALFRVLPCVTIITHRLLWLVAYLDPDEPVWSCDRGCCRLLGDGGVLDLGSVRWLVSRCEWPPSRHVETKGCSCLESLPLQDGALHVPSSSPRGV